MSVGKNPTETDAAIAYTQAKYPKIADMMRGIIPVRPGLMNRNTPSGFKGTAGIYYPESNHITVASDLPMKQAVETVGHEMTHGLQANRPTVRPLGYKPRQDAAQSSYLRGLPQAFKANILNGRYHNGAEWAESLGLPEVDAYSANPYEAQAERGGATAKQTYLEFLKRRDEGAQLP